MPESCHFGDYLGVSFRRRYQNGKVNFHLRERRNAGEFLGAGSQLRESVQANLRPGDRPGCQMFIHGPP